jgi:hypothetical protein
MCSHNIIEDYIDIDPDRSKQIFYCIHCFKTFNGPISQIIQQITLYDNSQKPTDLTIIKEKTGNLFKQEILR